MVFFSFVSNTPVYSCSFSVFHCM